MRGLLPYLSFTALALTAGVTSIHCGSSSDSDGSNGDVARSELPRNLEPQANARDIESAAQGNAAFAFELYRKLSSKNPNESLFFSPHSISAALAMTYAGARGSTAEAFERVLHIATPAKFHDAMNALDLALATRGRDAKGADGKLFRLRATNSIWGNRTTTFRQPFLDVLARDYGAGIRLTDFISATEESRRIINQWTNDETEGRINELLPEGVIKQETRLVLVNAIYFNAAWNTPFPASATSQEAFVRADGSSTRVDTMKQRTDFPYFEEDGYQAVELPYGGKDTSMVVVLPKEGTWATFELKFDAAAYRKITSNLSIATVDLSLPKFEIQGASTKLKEELSGMGLDIAFNEGAADFSGMTDRDPLVMSEVVHKAFVKVDEKGTEAAAATAVVMVDASAPPPPTNVKTFKANRPFFFFVRDVPTGALLFAGRVVDPSH
ncbi:serpin family protein [Pendulispora brunnea]|uniref:Serpin family protein n=1 Tax=Pendulispora brunnea TaxID=2905690 RepID=A0ABZ2KHS2_9BACT